MTKSADNLATSAARYGVDEVKIYTPSDLDPMFMAIQKDLFEEQERYAWYCWKPYIVMDAILKMDEGSYLIYCDAGNTVVGDVKQVIRCMDSDVMLFSNGWQHTDWCTGDILNAINHQQIKITQTMSGQFADYGELAGKPQVQASTIFLRVSPASKRFIQEWYSWSLMPDLISNKPSKLPNSPTFSESRWDQAILGSMAIKYNMKLRWFPTLTAAHLPKAGEDNYQPILEHHRRRNEEWT